MSEFIKIDLDPEEDTLRRFGFIALGGFGLLAVAAYTESLVFSFGLGAARLPVTASLAGLGVLSALLSLIAPRANRPIFVGLSLAAFPIGFVVSHVLLVVLFFLVISPVALLFRLRRRDELRLATDPSASTYWSEARPPRSNDSYFRQF